MDKIEKHQVYSPPGQGSPKLISNMTAPSLELPRKIFQTCTVMRRTAAPIAQRSFHTTQMVSQQEEIKEDSIPESYSNCKHSTTGTVEGRTISKQDWNWTGKSHMVTSGKHKRERKMAQMPNRF